MAHKKRGLTCSWLSMKLCLLTAVICSGVSYFLFTSRANQTSVLATKQVIFYSQRNPFQETSLTLEVAGEKEHLKNKGNNTTLRLHLTTLSHLKTNNTTPKNEEYHKDPLPYTFLIPEEDKCKETTPFLVFLICTKENEKLRRNNIRKTWGNESLVPGFSVVRLFMLGVQKQGSTEAIKEESRMYRDIIQQDFQDTYHNLTLKVLMGMKWVASYCPNAQFVMKTDTDMFVNTEYLIQKLLVTISTSKLYFTGFPMRKYHPIRHKESKWYMPLEVYPENFYPDFCSGTGYVFSGRLATMIYQVSFNVKILHLEDVYVGLCLQKMGVIVSSPPRVSLFNTFKVPFNPCVYNKLITSHYMSPNELLTFWELMQKKKHNCFQNSIDRVFSLLFPPS
ncbi:beta-1,3-galactosyltransferase 2-like [Gracilinanus agilis]|uniref:beta-1,3-galactosyltransferase 2-like n=1 Tax=Gracilinanus agilis TaxID=191870 RepID=UPI001CFD912F|nr:beta-1,3-galactosyltransferase 2-like [Gracilinanus agilis]